MASCAAHTWEHVQWWSSALLLAPLAEELGTAIAAVLMKTGATYSTIVAPLVIALVIAIKRTMSSWPLGFTFTGCFRNEQ